MTTNKKLHQFIHKSKTLYGPDKYDYSDVVFKTVHTKVNIRCIEHDFVFSITPVNHLLRQSSGCIHCTKIKHMQTYLNKYGVTHHLQNPDQLEKLKHTNINKYGVEFPAQYQLFKDKRVATCISKYGVSHPLQHPDILDKLKNTNYIKYGTLNVNYIKHSHMNNILRLIEDYDWLIDQYITQNKTASQISLELGISDVTIGRYLQRNEITIKLSCKYSFFCISWLESIMEQERIFIQHALNGGEYSIPGTRYKADGYCKETNTIYEFHGDYWHGNPLIYESEVINESTNCTMGELYQKTLLKEQKLIELGYNLIIMWESNFNEL